MVTGESTKETVKTIACGNAGFFRWTCGDYARVLFSFAREAAGALGARHSPRPLFSGRRMMHNSGDQRRGIAEVCRQTVWLFEIEVDVRKALHKLASRKALVMPGLVPGIHVLLSWPPQRRGWPGQARP
jgi:hypothetical protein